MTTEEQQIQKQREYNLHNSNLSGGYDEDNESAEILNFFADIDDLPDDISDDPVMGQMVSQLVSTSNLSKAQVQSNEWIRELIMVLYLSKYPKPQGCHGTRRAIQYGGDMDEALEPMDPSKRAQIEAFVSSSKLALTRSEDAKAIEESTRTISESIVNDENANSGGGILDKLNLR